MVIKSKIVKPTVLQFGLFMFVIVEGSLFCVCVCVSFEKRKNSVRGDGQPLGATDENLVL